MEDSLNVVATASEEIDFELKAHKKGHERPHGKKNKCPKYRKPARPCLFSGKPQSCLKRHILTKHKQEQKVISLLKLSQKEQDFAISQFKAGFLRERKTQKDGEELPVMCSGCHGFFKKKYKSRHKQICPANGSNLMLPMVSIESTKHVEKFSNVFKNPLNTLRLDKFGDCIESDKIILMIGNRSLNSLKRKKDKKEETSKYARARMRLTARVLIALKNVYDNQTEVKLEHKLENAGDIFRCETIIILGEEINKICERSETVDTEVADSNESLIGQKSGLKISILNLLKHNAKYLIGYFLMKNQEDNSKRVTDFLQVLRLVEDEISGDALYDISYRRNVKQRKPKTLPNNEDVQKLLDACIEVMTSINVFNAFSEQFVTVGAATATYLIVFNARRGGQSVRLLISQWEEALKGEWTDHLPDDDENTDLLVTFQTGKGADHLDHQKHTML